VMKALANSPQHPTPGSLRSPAAGERQESLSGLLSQKEGNGYDLESSAAMVWLGRACCWRCVGYQQARPNHTIAALDSRS